MKSTTQMVEITTQKNEKYLYKERNPLACLPACLLASCQLRNFCVSLLKSVLTFLTNQAAQFLSRGIGHCNFFRNFLLSFLSWYDLNHSFHGMTSKFQSNQGEGVHSYVQHRQLMFGRSNFFFQLKAKHPVFHFLDLDGTILNLIQPKINKKLQNFYPFLKFSRFYPLSDFRILVQIYQLIIQFDQTQLTQKSAAKILSRRCQNSQENENTQTSELNSKFFQKSVRNMIHHYNCQAFIIQVLFTVPFYHFQFSRNSDLKKTAFFVRYFGSISRFQQFVSCELAVLPFT